MKIKIVILLIIVAFSIVYSSTSKKIEIIYFHIDHRCELDLSIEEMTKKIINNDYQDYLENNTIELKIINWETAPENYENEYELINQALYLNVYSNDAKIESIELKKVWDYVNDPAEFEKYLKKEINKRLEL